MIKNYEKLLTEKEKKTEDILHILTYYSKLNFKIFLLQFTQQS